MRYRPLLTLLLLWMIAGCGGDGTTAPPDSMQQADNSLRDPNRAGPAADAAGKNASPVRASNIPANARYAIVCERYSGAGHEQQARLVKDGLVHQTGRADFHVVHEAQSSLLMYGYYAEVDQNFNAAESTRVKTDRKWLESLKSSMGTAMFRQCVAIALPSPNPDAPPEWDLTKLDRDRSQNDPNRRYWTIVIAAYTNKAVDDKNQPLNQKQLAIETVRAARAQNVEAYYYLGDEMSQVCIGAWPRSAIKAQEGSSAGTREDRRTNSNKELYVSATPMSPEERRRVEASGKKVFAPKLEVQSPDLLRTWQKYPEYAVDGLVKVDKETSRPQESFLAEVPRTQASILAGDSAPTPAVEQVAPPVINPIAPSANTGGRLRRVDQ